ncbi:hypothetical protein BH24BAC1_BH24BAC1_26850 [soil metagenome]
MRVVEKAEGEVSLPLPINVLTGNYLLNPEIRFEGDANFVLLAEGKPRLSVVNGFIFDLEEPLEQIHNGLVFY